VGLFGEPVFRYGVEQAIREGFLVDYEAVGIKSGVQMNGLFLQEGEKVSKIDTETGEETFDQVEDERAFRAEEIEEPTSRYSTVLTAPSSAISRTSRISKSTPCSRRPSPSQRSSTTSGKTSTASTTSTS
jgi:type I site-specific restriction endonuclease